MLEYRIKNEIIICKFCQPISLFSVILLLSSEYLSFRSFRIYVYSFVYVSNANNYIEYMHTSLLLTHTYPIIVLLTTRLWCRRLFDTTRLVGVESKSSFLICRSRRQILDFLVYTITFTFMYLYRIFSINFLCIIKSNLIKPITHSLSTMRILFRPSLLLSWLLYYISYYILLMWSSLLDF